MAGDGRIAGCLRLRAFGAAVGAVAVCLVTSLLASAKLYYWAELGMKEELQRNIRAWATYAASTVDGDLHRSITLPEHKDNPAYRETVKGLKAIRRHFQDIYYSYSMITQDGKYYFILDSAPDGDADGDGVNDRSQVMEEYPEAFDDPALLQVFAEKKPVSSDEPYTDKWGSFISGFAPFYDSAGAMVGVVGVDMKADRYLAHIAKMHHAALMGGGVAALLSLLLGGLVYYWRLGNLRAAHGLVKAKADLEVALEDAKKANRAKGNFIATISHEIRTPINGIMGITRIIKDTKLSASNRDLLEVIEHSAEHLLSVVNEVLDYSRVESNAIELQNNPLDVRSVAKDAVNIIAPRVDTGLVSLEMHVDDAVSRLLLGDEVRIRQLLINFLGNALKFTHRGFIRLRVTGEAVDGGVQHCLFEVEDSGIGIPQEKLDLIFERFTQVDQSTTRKYEGAGLGLAICRELVEKMGGSIGVESEVDKGSRFWFRLALPVVEDADVKPRLMATLSEALADVSVLIAEDNKVNLLVAQKTLEKLGCRRVLAAENGQAALDIVQTHSVDVVLMDLHMPVMDGFDSTLAIRALPDSKERPFIIACTADIQPETRERCLSLGMNGFLSKPYTAEKLMEALSHAVFLKDAAAG